MKNNLSTPAKEALKKLGIDDFRHVTKEQVINLVSNLQNMNPEIAKEIIHQFPELTKATIAIFSNSVDYEKAILSSNEENEKKVYEILSDVCKSYQKQLDDPNIDDRTREDINQKLFETAKLAAEHANENKKFLEDRSNAWKTFGLIGLTIFCVAFGVRSPSKTAAI